jgi:alkylation response protein AidB-like acyl-CoA dehydrogenase
MELTLTDEQQMLCEQARKALSKTSTYEVVRAAEPLGFDRDVWRVCVDLGLVSMAVDEDRGGGGAGLMDLVLIADETGRRLAPAPWIECAVSARLLASVDASDLLADVCEGTTIATVAPRPARGGTASLVPAGALATVVIALDGDELVAVRSDPGTHISTMGCLPLADRCVRDSTREVLASGLQAFDLHGRAVDELRLLTASAVVGLAADALELGTAYVTERRQFGVPIGSFQTVAHRLADCATEVDGARLLCQEAAWGADAAVSRASTLAAMALAFAAQTAQHVSAESLHFHGGYGFMLEYDVQLHFRRAKAWPLVLGDPRRLFETVAAAMVDEQEGAVSWTSA